VVVGVGVVGVVVVVVVVVVAVRVRGGALLLSSSSASRQLQQSGTSCGASGWRATGTSGFGAWLSTLLHQQRTRSTQAREYSFTHPQRGGSWDAHAPGTRHSGAGGAV
jgi:hypothetical protein